MKYTIIYFITLATLLTSCHKQPTMPAITNNGANVIAYKVDGNVVIVSGNNNRQFMDPFGVTYNPRTWYGFIIVDGYNEKPKSEISIKLIYNDTLGNRPIITGYNPNTYIPLGASYVNESSNSAFTTDSSHGGTINIIACSSKHISGTFAFDAINDDGKVIHITEGRFDITNK